MPHSAKTPVPVFKQLPHLEDLSDVEERSDSNDADFEFTRIQFVGDLISTS